MAFLRTTVTGNVTLPGGSAMPDGAKVIFTLRSWDKDDDTIAAHGPIAATVEGGAISVRLIRSASTDRMVGYDVGYLYWNEWARRVETTLGGQAALDQVRGRRGLGHTFGASTTRIFWAHGHDDPQLRRHNLQPLRAVFADAVHLATTTRAEQTARLYHPLDAGQAFRKMPAIAAGSPARGRTGRSLRILPGLGLGHSRFQILEGQLALVIVQLLGAFAMHDLVQLGDQMLQPPVCFPQRIPFPQHGKNSGALAFGDDGQVDGRGC
jgi:hypothetical protein